jgi:hypothetical protein
VVANYLEPEKSLEDVPKPRTALFKGGEDDESMTSQITITNGSMGKCIDFEIFRR